MENIRIMPMCWKCERGLWAKNKGKDIVEHRLYPLIFKGCKDDSRITWKNRGKYCALIYK